MKTTYTVPVPDIAKMRVKMYDGYTLKKPSHVREVALLLMLDQWDHIRSGYPTHKMGTEWFVKKYGDRPEQTVVIYGHEIKLAKVVNAQIVGEAKRMLRATGITSKARDSAPGVTVAEWVINSDYMLNEEVQAKSVPQLVYVLKGQEGGLKVYFEARDNLKAKGIKRLTVEMLEQEIHRLTA